MSERSLLKVYFLILMFIKSTGVLSAADITINAAAPAKPIRIGSLNFGYHHKEFYFEISPAYKRMHDLMNEISHKRRAFKYWRCQNIFTYRNDPPGSNSLRYQTEIRSGHCYDTKRYADTGGYNWSKVDEVYDEMVTRSGFTPIVEFNYMPECMALDPTEIGGYGDAVISPPKDYNEWKELVINTVNHLQEQYGKSEIKQWYWGVWNEPNHAEFWDEKKYGYHGFIKLYDYSAVPMKEIDSDLKIGGPDNTVVMERTYQFVKHTHQGKNFYNGEIGSPCEYYSIHAYNFSVRSICKSVWRMVAYLNEFYGKGYYDGQRTMITETAPNWWRFKVPFLQTRYTAAWFLGLSDAFLEAADQYGLIYLPVTINYCAPFDGLNMRSLVVQIDRDINSDQVLKTAPFNFHEIMSLLSEERIPVQGCDFPTDYTNVHNTTNMGFNQIRCMATRTFGRSIEILVYHFDQGDRLVYNLRDDGSDPPQPYGTYRSPTPITHDVSLTVNNIPFTNARLTKYVIDKYHSNSYAYRQMNGGTKNYDLLNAQDDLEQTENKVISISDGRYTENFKIQQNSVTLFVLENENIESGQAYLGTYIDSLNFGYYTDSTSFTIYNYGDQTLIWSANESLNQGWILIEPASGSLEPNTNQTVWVKVDRSGLNDGEYNSTIDISSNGGGQNVGIRMNVGTPPLPKFYRINAGGTSYQDTQGRTWSSDREYTQGEFGYVGGAASSTEDSISRAQDDILYQSERYNVDAYRFDIPDGNYKVTLHLAEIYFKTANERIMSVAIEGEVKISDLDIFQTIGHDAALVYTFSDIPVTDGRMDITFSASSRVPKVSAIEVIDMNLIEPGADNEPPQPPQNVQVNQVTNP